MSRNGLPHFAMGEVIKGFGRGSKELGIPTANFPTEVVNQLPQEINTGVYFGFGQVDEGPVHKMVMSVGWNPYYKNTQKSMETYLMHTFENDFYGNQLRVCMLGYIRPEADFTTLDDLISTIRKDISIADEELNKSEYDSFKLHAYFSNCKADTS